MPYDTLKKYYYSQANKQKESVDDEYRKRINSYTTFKTMLTPYLMDVKKEELRATTQYPLFVVNLPEITIKSERIKANSNKIKKISNSLPPIAGEQYFLNTLVQEILSTNEIEGVHSTREEISFAIRNGRNNNKDKVRLQSTSQMYIDAFHENFIKINTLEDIREIYDKLISDEIEDEDKLDGSLFRSGEVHIESYNRDKVVHYAPTGESEIKSRLNDWLQFINSKEIPFLIKGILGHFFFENIHPFYDGNGRTGRYILSVYLSRKLDPYTGMSFSQAVERDKKEYYGAFSDLGNVENRAEATFFVLSLLNLILDSQEIIIESLTERKSDFLDLVEHIDQAFSEDEPEHYILFLLAQSRQFNNDETLGLIDNDIFDMAGKTQFSKHKLKQTMKRLEEEEYIKVINKIPKQHVLTEKVLG